MQTLTIAGIEYPGHCFQDGMYLFVYLTGVSMIDGFQILSNPNNLSVIFEKNYEHERSYSGFTVLKSINSDYGNCNAVLIREVD